LYPSAAFSLAERGVGPKDPLSMMYDAFSAGLKLGSVDKGVRRVLRRLFSSLLRQSQTRRPTKPRNTTAPATLDAITTGVATPPDLVFPEVVPLDAGESLLASPAAVPGFKGVEGGIAPTPSPGPALLVGEGDGLISLKDADNVSAAGGVGTAFASVWLVPGAGGGNTTGTAGTKEDEEEEAGRGNWAKVGDALCTGMMGMLLKVGIVAGGSASTIDGKEVVGATGGGSETTGASGVIDEGVVTGRGRAGRGGEELVVLAEVVVKTAAGGGCVVDDDGGGGGGAAGAVVTGGGALVCGGGIACGVEVVDWDVVVERC